MSLHRAILVRKDLHGILGIVKDHIPLGGSYVVDMSWRSKSQLINGTWVEMVHVTGGSGAGMAPMALYEIEEGEIE